MKIKRLDLAASRLAEIQDAGSIGTRVKILLREMEKSSHESMRELQRPSKHAVKMANAMRKLNII